MNRIYAAIVMRGGAGMVRFGDILARAAVRKGGDDALEALLVRPLPREAVAAIPGDRWLAEMTRCIFQAGFNWDLIDRRWPQFEAAFEGFDVSRWVFMSDDDLDRLLKTPGLVANAQKLRSVGQNALFLSGIAQTSGSAGAWFAGWPFERYFELCAEMKAKGSRLGGATGQRMLRRMGVDAFILTPTVVKALNLLGWPRASPFPGMPLPVCRRCSMAGMSRAGAA